MISPESLRRYPYFAGVSDDSLKSVAMIAEEKSFRSGERLLAEKGRAEQLMILTKGEVEIVFDLPGGKQSGVGSLAAGDLIAVSALLDPYEHTTGAVARSDGASIAIHAAKLRELCQADPVLGYRLMQQVAVALRNRLNQTRIQLVGMS